MKGNQLHADLHREMVELAKEHSSGQKQDMLIKLFNTKGVSVKLWRYFSVLDSLTFMEPLVISLCKALKANLNSLKLQWQWQRHGIAGGQPLVSCQGIHYRPFLCHTKHIEVQQLRCHQLKPQVGVVVAQRKKQSERNIKQHMRLLQRGSV